MKGNSQRKIKSRGRFEMSGLTRRYFQQQILMNFLILFGVAIIIMLTFIGTARLTIIKDADQSLVAKANEIAAMDPIDSEAFNSLDSGHGMFYIAYFDANNVYLPSYGNIAGRPEKFYTTLDEGKLDKTYRIKYADREYRAIQRRVVSPARSADNFTVKIMVNITGRETLLNSLVITMVILISAAVAFLLLISCLMATMQIAPYNKAVMNSQEFTSNASHEINTPLTIIKTNLQNIMMQPDDKVSDVSGNIAVSLSEIDRLQHLTKQLLVLSRSDDKRLRFNYEPINVRSIVESVCEPYSIIAEEQDKELKVDFEDGFELPMYADKAIITQILVALLDNEIKYTRSYMEIHVKCGFQGEDRYFISVSDNGDGVEDNELENIFMRFYRSDKSRHSPGTGLGLSIVHALVKAMNGTIIAGNLRPHGLKITITLPILKESDLAR